MPVGHKEEIIVVVPRYLVDLHLELFLSFNLVRLDVNKGYQILLVAHSDGLTVGTPAYVDIFTCDRKQEYFCVKVLAF